MAYIWRMWCLAIWFGIMFAVCTVIIAIALLAVLLPVGYGLASPSRTPASTLRLLVANTGEGILHVRALLVRS